jgi:peroxiredoxin Q/BCP
MNFRRILACMSLFSLLFGAAKADPLKVGDAAPDVSVTTESGDKLKLADVYQKQPYTLVYFYPKADTPGCTKQGCSLRDGYEQLTKRGVAVIGVSHDTPEAQKAFKEKYHLPFTLVADVDQSASRAFGVPNMAPTQLAHRSAYLIRDGKIVYTDYVGTTDKQAETILKVLDEQKG